MFTIILATIVVLKGTVTTTNVAPNRLVPLVYVYIYSFFFYFTNKYLQLGSLRLCSYPTTPSPTPSPQKTGASSAPL